MSCIYNHNEQTYKLGIYEMTTVKELNLLHQTKFSGLVCVWRGKGGVVT